ncbi:MAG: acyltransferase family protein [Actinomycetota bacterium]
MSVASRRTEWGIVDAAHAPHEPRTERWPGSPWFAGLDGLRALAVGAVVAFHFAPTALPGGFLGVDLFFVLSGYLITRLLLGEVDVRGRLDLVDFYRRRVRRLVPAVVVLVVVAVAGAALFWPDELVTLRGGVPASLGYVANWWLIGEHQPYFVSAGRPPLLQHLWSLAIEEQFYLVWPCLLAIVFGSMFMLRSRTVVLTPGALARVALVAVVLALVSSAVMAALAIRSDVPYGADSGRVYFGTDTHAMGLLLGSAAGALSIVARFGVRRPILRGSFLTDVMALGALVALGAIATGVNEFSPGLYRGGFLAVSALCTVLVATVPRRGSLIGLLLERAPLRYLGERSYSIYLWHWPVAVLTRPGVDVHASAPLVLALRLLLTLGLAEASFRLVEQPFRRNGLRGVLAAVGCRSLSQAARLRLVAAAACVAVTVVASAAAALVAATPVDRRAVVADARAVPTSSASPAPTGSRRPASSGSPSRAAATAARRPAPAPVRPRQLVRVLDPRVSAFGDSVMLGAGASLRADLPQADISAIEGRQPRDVFADVAARQVAGSLASVVVIHAGDNGIISAADLAATLAALTDRSRIVVVTDRVPRAWQEPNNATLASAVKRHRNAVLVDWYRLSNGQPNWFYDDGLHLRPDGAAVYAASIAAAVRA